MPRSAALPVLLLSLSLVYAGSCMLVAGVASHRADSFLKDWENNGAEPDDRSWTVAHAAAQRAIDIYPVVNGHYQHQLGLIYQWKQFKQPLGARNAHASRLAALEAFRNAAIVQPTWPGHWAALAYAKLYLLEFDDEFHMAFDRAHALGPWRIEINRRLAEIGLMAWPHLTEAGRAILYETAHRTIEFSQKEAVRLLLLAEQVSMGGILCENMNPTVKKLHSLCQPGQ